MADTTAKKLSVFYGYANAARKVTSYIRNRIAQHLVSFILPSLFLTSNLIFFNLISKEMLPNVSEWLDCGPFCLCFNSQQSGLKIIVLSVLSNLFAISREIMIKSTIVHFMIVRGIFCYLI